MSYENMSIVELLNRWDEASADLHGSWMHWPAAHKTIAACHKELAKRGFFDRATVNAAPREPARGADGHFTEID